MTDDQTREGRAGISGRSGIVVGAAAGIGRAIASRLSQLGAGLLLVDASEEVVQIANGLDCAGLVLDVSSEEAPSLIVDEATNRFGAPDFLVNCAGVQSRGSVLDLPETEWRRLEAVNWSGLRRVSLAVARLMRDEGRGGGSIVNVTSSSVHSVTIGIIPYSVTKAAVAQLTRGLAAELGPAGIRVNAIAPGYVHTAMTSEVLDDPAFMDRLRPRIPLGYVARPEEMVGTVVFLLSDESSYVTGAVIPVDGGFTLGSHAG